MRNALASIDGTKPTCAGDDLSSLLSRASAKRSWPAYAIGGVRLVGFDNERGKGDHCHIRGAERSYNFSSVKQLIEDFITAVDAQRGQT